MIYRNFKSSRQVNYKPKTESDRVMHSNIETPLNVVLGRLRAPNIFCMILTYLVIMIKVAILRVILPILLLKE